MTRGWGRGAVVVALVGLVSAAHAVTNTHHSALHALYEYMYYVPILMAAYWFGFTGGIGAAVLCTVLYLPYIQMTWADNPAYVASQYGELVAFHLVGGIVGLLVGRLRRSTDEARAAADALSITNRELVESHQQLTRAERLSALGTLAAGLAHEVRTPIAAVRGALDILASRARAGTPEAEFTGVATRELTRLGELLEEFLAYARPRPPARVAVRLTEVLTRVEALLSSEAAVHGVRIDVDADGPGEITADPAQLTQVFLNVIMNAVQASPHGAAVTVRSRRTPAGVEVAVLDKGPGLPPEAAARLFEPFFTTKAKGTGLGLAIAQRIVTAHGGTIELAAVPDGTRATIRLPQGPPIEESA